MSTLAEDEPLPDDPEIADEDDLLRRVPNDPKLITRASDGTTRPSSAALTLRDGEVGCSVDILGRLPDPGAPLTVLTGHDPNWGVATCTAGDARADQLHRVVGKPELGDEAHAEVIPTATTRKAQKRNFKALAEKMTFLRDPVMAPPDVAVPTTE
ncbi:MAG TPA: hypothetical protein VK730_14450 [Solirubrobacteraceae bacterium]|nr:hypothetical protein [Solirubrobacteraceae bacterium]